MRRLITFDLDMTLLDHETWTIPDSATKAIELLKSNGHIVALATGRDMDAYYSLPFKNMVNPDATIELNGTKVVADNKLIYEHLFDKQLLKQLIKFCKENLYSIGFTVGDDDYYINEDIIIANDKKNWGDSKRNFKDSSHMDEMDIRTLAYIGSPEGAYDIEKHFPDLKLPLFAARMGADIIEKKASKAKGLNKLCEYYDIATDHTVSFGDSMNDYEIIVEAGIGIAMGNADENLKMVANYVTDDIAKDGIWKACKYYNLF